MNRILKAPNLNAIALGIGLLVTQKMSGDEAYLKSVGPPPLRFELVATNNTLFICELTLPKPKEAKEPGIPIAPAMPVVFEREIAGGTENRGQVFGEAAKNSGILDNPASNLLSITPEMINKYFKPEEREAAPAPNLFQPGQVIFVPAELGFVPPTPQSRAIYNSK